MKTKTQNKLTKTLLTILGLAFFLAGNNSFASFEYIALIPNGPVISCSACHVNANPDLNGTARNAFGLAWRNNTPARTWNALLAAQDTDADGFTNGQELGDPAGTWVQGSANPPSQPFNPGDAASHPTAATIAPTITSVAPPAAGTVGGVYNFTVTASGTAPVTFSASGLPGGLAINSAGVIAGTATTAGTFNGTITAANGTLPNATQAFSIVIGVAGSSNRPPTVQIVFPDHHNNRFVAGKDILLAAEARDKDGSVTSVEFFVGEISLGFAEFVPDDEEDNHGNQKDDDGDDNKSRNVVKIKSNRHLNRGVYVLMWTSVPAGQYVVTARAVDNSDDSTDSKSIRISVGQNRRR